MAKALLVIDLQEDYFPGGAMELEGVEQASNNAAHLLATFRKRGNPVFHVKHVFQSDEAPFFRPNSAGIAFHPSVVPADGETVITKHHVNSFHETDLQKQLDSIQVDGAEINSLVICGAMSHMCVEGTTRAAADLGYKCQVIHDACATCAQSFNGVEIPAAEVHGTAMAALGFAYAEVKSLGEWLAI